MDFFGIIELVKKSISENKIQEAFNHLETLLSTLNLEELEDELVLIRSMYNSLKKEMRLGQISYSDFSQTSNRINKSVIGLLNEIKKVDTFDEIVSTTKQRTASLGKRAKLVYEIIKGQVIRQKAINSSFSIPNRDIEDSIWQNWPENRDFHWELRQERIWLGKHLEGQYGKLILMPFKETTYKKDTPKYALIRLRLLYEFITTNKDKIDIVTITEEEVFKVNNLTIIGSTFYIESNTRIDDGWGNNTISTKEVMEKIYEFDQEFEKLLEIKGLDLFSSKNQALEEIKQEIEKLERRIRT